MLTFVFNHHGKQRIFGDILCIHIDRRDNIFSVFRIDFISFHRNIGTGIQIADKSSCRFHHAEDCHMFFPIRRSGRYRVINPMVRFASNPNGLSLLLEASVNKTTFISSQANKWKIPKSLVLFEI